jgi:hypothetical protein
LDFPFTLVKSCNIFKFFINISNDLKLFTFGGTLAHFLPSRFSTPFGSHINAGNNDNQGKDIKTEIELMQNELETRRTNIFISNRGISNNFFHDLIERKDAAIEFLVVNLAVNFFFFYFVICEVLLLNELYLFE